METRVRMHMVGLALVALSQGIPFVHAGDDLLRSKSLDRGEQGEGGRVTTHACRLSVR